MLMLPQKNKAIVVVKSHALYLLIGLKYEHSSILRELKFNYQSLFVLHILAWLLYMVM